MSRIEKLKVLLARVEQRRHEPRLVAVSNASAQPSANTNVARAPQPQLELAKPSLEHAIATPAPSSMPPPAEHAFGSDRAAARTSSIPPPAPARTPAPPPPSSTVPPAQPPRAPEALGRAPSEVVAPTPQRIAPAPVAPFDSAVKTTSPARTEVPKTFGELLEQSLALRPKSG